MDEGVLVLIRDVLGTVQNRFFLKSLRIKWNLQAVTVAGKDVFFQGHRVLFFPGTVECLPLEQRYRSQLDSWACLLRSFTNVSNNNSRGKCVPLTKR